MPSIDTPSSAQRGTGRPGPTTAFFAAARAALLEDDATQGCSGGMSTYRDALAVYQRASDAVPSVVVVGEIGRGKSTLVNALLGCAEASPTGPGETTGCYLAFQPADDTLPNGTAEIECIDGARIRVPFDEIASRVRIAEEGSQEVRSIAPLGARVGWSGLPFPGAWIVDTPGAGGLDPDHARIALSRAATASVLVMVTDAFGVLTDSALRFLERCSERVASVIVVVTKIDIAGDWAKVVDDDRRVLRTSAVAMVRDAPVVAVSAATRLRALSASNPDVGARRIARSRFGELDALLRERLELGDRLGRARGIHMLETRLRGVARSAGLDAAALRDERVVHDTEADQRRIAELRSHNATWRLVLEQRVGAVRFALTESAQTRLRELGERWQHRVDELPWRANDATTRQLHAELTTELFTILDDLQSRSEEQLTDAVVSTIGDLGLPLPAEALNRLPVTASAFQPHGLRESAGGGGPADALLGFQGLRIGWMAGIPLLAVNPALGVGVVVASAVGTVALQLLTRGQQLRKRNLELSVAKNVAELSSHVLREFDRHTLDLRPELTRIVERAISDELQQVQRRLALAASVASTGEQARRGRIEDLDRGAIRADRLASTGADLVRRTLSSAGLPGPGRARPEQEPVRLLA